MVLSARPRPDYGRSGVGDGLVPSRAEAAAATREGGGAPGARPTGAIAPAPTGAIAPPLRALADTHRSRGDVFMKGLNDEHRI